MLSIAYHEWLLLGLNLDDRSGHRVLIDPYKFAAELLPLEFHSYTAYIRHRELPAKSRLWLGLLKPDTKCGIPSAYCYTGSHNSKWLTVSKIKQQFRRQQYQLLSGASVRANNITHLSIPPIP